MKAVKIAGLLGACLGAAAWTRYRTIERPWSAALIAKSDLRLLMVSDLPRTYDSSRNAWRYGKAPDGRQVCGLRSEETERSVTITAQFCHPLPGTSVGRKGVRLQEPLGDRDILDGTRGDRAADIVRMQVRDCHSRKGVATQYCQDSASYDRAFAGVAFFSTK